MNEEWKYAIPALSWIVLLYQVSTPGFKDDRVITEGAERLQECWCRLRSRYSVAHAGLGIARAYYE